jgi:hypothetical protein
MPFWPDKPDTCAKATRPTPFPISWIWPLIDSPHQGPCPGLLDNTLATSLAPGGRLAGLLAAGGAYSAKARLTWAIDPALLDNARTMSQKYPVGDSPSCTGATTHPADTSARAWLAGVTRATTGQPVFVTPYADVDVAGLARYGDKPDLQKAFSIGQQLAAPILHRDRVPATIPAGPAKLSAVAWPAGGHVSPISLGVLGAMKIGTVILAMPPSQLSYTPGAVTTELDGVGTKVTVLLGDYSLSKLLASGAATSRRAGTIFGVSQLFLAETAMIVAEAPAMQRPMVVTPPRRWNPAGKLAGKLLADTVAAPWLRTSTVGQISARPQAYPSPLVQPQARGELPGKLLRQLTGLDSSVSLLQSIMLTNDSRLSRTVFGIESSRWAGADPDVAQAMLATTRQFIANQFAGLSVGGQHVINVTLGGRVGSVTVSIRNSLGYAVRVGLKVSSSNNTVTAKQRHAQLYVVQPHSSTGLKLSVNATQTGKATVKVSLMSRTGILLPNPPDKPLIMRISATNLGTVALVIFAAALAVFVVASAAQALRRGGPGASQSADQEDPPVPGGPADAAGADTHEPEDDAQDSPARLDRTDNVVGDRSELSSVGRRPVEESR